jgi:acyl-CoA synthetase (AMP-forming)/AMP-acid ligase II
MSILSVNKILLFHHLCFTFYPNKVVDIATREALGPNDEGEILLKGPSLMKEYLDNDEANTDAFDSDGWYLTGNQFPNFYYRHTVNLHISTV